jgi:hypothetical protein
MDGSFQSGCQGRMEVSRQRDRLGHSSGIQAPTIQKSCSGQVGHFHGASGGEVNKKARAGWVEAGTEPDSHSSR